jgi:replicative DNA helicase
MATAVLLDTRRADDTPRLVPVADLLDDFMADTERRYEARRAGVALGPVTGFPALDDAVGGCLMPGLHVFHGGPGTGKTAFAWQAAAQAARCGAPAVFVTCEMGPPELLARAIARETGTYLGRIKSGELAPSAMLDLARRTLARLPNVYLVDGIRAWPSAGWLAEALASVRGDSGHALLVIDSIHTWSLGLESDKSEYDTLTFAINALSQLGADSNVPVLGVAERNRASMERGGLHAGAGTRRFEYAATSMIDLSREDTEGKDRSSFPGTVPPIASVRATVVKNRHGNAPIRVDLLFEGRCQRFAEE